MLTVAVSPLVLDRDSGTVGWKTALAGNHGGGGGGGNGGGGNGGGNGGNGNSGGNTSGGGTSGGSTGNANTGNIISENAAGDDNRKLLMETGVAVAQFTTRISKRNPADNVALLDNPHQAINFYTEVRGMTGRTITHRWTYGGEVEYVAEFKIRGATWKFWSTQLLPTDKTGNWRVEIVDDSGAVLKDRTLIYQPAD